MTVGGELLPLAEDLGQLRLFTYSVLVVTQFAFLGSAWFFYLSRTVATPEHRTGITLTSVLCLVAGLSYFFIRADCSALLQRSPGRHQRARRVPGERTAPVRSLN